MALEPIALAAPMLANLDEAALRDGVSAVLENGYITEAGTLARFPGLTLFTTLPNPTQVYLDQWRGDLIAVNAAGSVYRIDLAGHATDMTGARVVGGRRPTFAHTDDDLLIAAGGPIIRYNGAPTTILSQTAPDSTHVGYVDGYVVALEPRSGRFWHSNVGVYDRWDPLNVFSATGKPEDISSLFVTPFNELLLFSGVSTEQFEASAQGDTPFFRRWLAGEGILAPYSALWEDNATWLVNQKSELVRLAGQVGQVRSFAIQKVLEAIDDWRDCWAQRLSVAGQRFILLQMPHATNAYGTKGVTLAHNTRNTGWSFLYGWDPVGESQACWPGRSVVTIAGRHYVGGEGRIHLLDPALTGVDGQPMASLWRSAHLDMGGTGFRVDNVVIRLKRGVATAGPALLQLRANRDNRGWGRWRSLEIGRPGDRVMTRQLGAWGAACSMQFEIRITDAVPWEVAGFEWERTVLA